MAKSNSSPVGRSVCDPGWLGMRGALGTIVFVLFFCAGFFFVGCTGGGQSGESKNRGSESKIPTKDRPPLKVVVVDPALAAELELRWKTVSDQPIAIESISLQQALERSQDETDVWIYPGNLMGSFISKELIAPLPAPAMGKIPDDLKETITSGNVLDAWPARWKNATRYGSNIYALPLGSAQYAMVSRKVPLDPLASIDEASNTTDDRTGAAVEAWKKVLQEPGNATSKGISPPSLDSLTASQRDDLVDRYLWIVSTTNARRRGFFDLTRMQPRLSTPDFVLAADVFSQLVEKYPALLVESPSASWNITLQKGDEPSLSIGWPASRTDESAEEPATVEIGKLAWNPNRGLLVSLGRKTRQTSVSNQFIAWLSEPEQRAALAPLSEGVERWPSQADPNAIKQDVRSYQNLNNRDVRPEPMNLSLRFANAQAYREALADTLIEILKTPERARELLTECNAKWNELTEKFGIGKQRASVEQSLGVGS